MGDDDGHATSGSSIYFWLGIIRFFVGVGVGGEYPLSATITSEATFSTNNQRITSLCSVFSMQGIGRILSGLVLILVTHTFSDYEWMWRFALAFGAVPMLISLYPRWKKLHESDLFLEQQENQRQQEEQKQEDSLTGILPPTESTSPLKVMKENWSILLGTAGSWFLLDIVFYGNGLFSGSVTKAMGLSSSIKEEALQSFILQLIALPGYIFSILYMAKVGCKQLQIYGFGVLSLVFLIMSIFQGQLVSLGYVYLFIYGLTFFIENFGPNATVYVIPSFVFPTRGRSTLHGASAAFGKMGAVVGTFTLLYVKDSFCEGSGCSDDETGDIERGIRLTFGICAIVSLIGLVWTHVFVTDVIHSDLALADFKAHLHDPAHTKHPGDEAMDNLERQNEFDISSGNELDSKKESKGNNNPDDGYDNDEEAKLNDINFQDEEEGFDERIDGKSERDLTPKMRQNQIKGSEYELAVLQNEEDLL